MPGRRTAKKTGLASLFSILAAAALLWLFAPTTLGGNFSYVVVSGNSMAPRLGTGDLVLLRAASHYEVGDAVTYHHPQLGPVLHRIVAVEGEHFTLRGDNRDGNDEYQPTRDDIIGREWFAIPNGGRVVRELQSSRNLALLSVSTMLLGVLGGTSTSSGRRFRSVGRLSAIRPRRDLSVYSQSGRQLLLIGLGLAAGSLTLLVLYAASGPTRDDTEPIPFTERGEFSYGGPVAGGVYDQDLLTAPQPLFRQLSDELALRFSYEIAAPEAAIENVLGTFELVAIVSSEDGWARTFPLEPVTRFASERFDMDTTLALNTLELDLAQIAERTGVAAGRYSIQLVARVEATGLADGFAFESDYEHSAQFRLSELQLQLDGEPDALVFTENRSVGRPISVGRVLDIPMVPVNIPYSQIPLLGGVGLGLGLVLLLAVAGATHATRQRGEAARIRAAYGLLLVEVAQERAAFGPRPHDVADFADLVRLASAEGLAIMHRSSPSDDEYLVTASDRSWRYATSRPVRRGGLTDRHWITTDEG